MRIAFFGDSLTSGAPGSSYFALLHRRFPDHTLLNLGKGNDTVVSLFRRLSALRFDAPFDLAFLWIGVNDVHHHRDWWPYRVFSALLGQRRARDTDEFRACYQATLDLLCANAKRVVAAPPVLKGENLEHSCNHRLATLAESMRDLAADYERVEFLDLRAIFVQELAQRPISDYVMRNPLRVLLDTLTLRTDEQTDGKATERGLHLTLDGVHLNTAGARLVAEAFAEPIQQTQEKPL
jgi:lysophospholipase L1-like esterase